MKENYLKQVGFLLEILPILNKHDAFALKGGTAINFFFQNLPRLSVDIDLNYLPIEPRALFLSRLSDELRELANAIAKLDDNIVVKQYCSKTDEVTKLRVFNENVEVKIEPNLVLRGYVFEPEKHAICQKLQEQFFQSFKIKTMSMADVYGGKICAALDRQHPRDLFDVKLLLEQEGLTDAIRTAFVIYLASGPRPMHELLSPNFIDISNLFFKEFLGMTDVQLTIDALLESRKQLIKILQKDLTEKERLFLFSIKKGQPDWGLLQIPHLETLPALRWKLENIQKMNKKKHDEMLEKLKRALDL